MKNERRRVILDTNKIISGLLKPDSRPDKAIQKAFDECNIFVSEETLEELQDVLFKKSLIDTSPFGKRFELAFWRSTG
jgi:predicted nucleic acid-binding protein